MGNGPGATRPATGSAATPSAIRCSGTGPRAAGSRTGTPWLPLDDPAERNVADQRGDRSSLLSFYRELIALRRTLPAEFEAVEDIPGVVSYRRGDRLVAINVTEEPALDPRRRGPARDDARRRLA